MEVTESQLATALDGFTLWVAPEEGQDTRHTFAGKVVNAPHAARSLLDKIAEAKDDEPEHCPDCHMPLTMHHDPGCSQPCGRCEARKADGAAPGWIEITRDEFAALLAGLRVGTERPLDWKMGPTAMLSRPEAVADAIASHSHGLRANEAYGDDDVVDAHICCEHADTDPELAAMAEIKRLLEAPPVEGYAVIRALYPLDGAAMLRVCRWALARFPDPADVPF